jgi:hypothetical protein
MPIQYRGIKTLPTKTVRAGFKPALTVFKCGKFNIVEAYKTH